MDGMENAVRMGEPPLLRCVGEDFGIIRCGTSCKSGYVPSISFNPRVDFIEVLASCRLLRFSSGLQYQIQEGSLAIRPKQ